MSGPLTVHLRVNDSGTGEPTPVRLRVTGPNSKTFAPLGRFAEFPFGRGEEVGGHLLLGRDESHFYVDGSCEIPLPAGAPLEVEVSKGPEYRPLCEAVTLGAGQMTLRLSVERRADLRSEGWYSGDTRAHFLSPHAALLEGAAEGLDVVNLLAAVFDVPSQNGKLYPAASNLLAFSGGLPALERGGCVVAVNTFNTHAALGRLALLNCHRVVYPLTFGGRDAADDWSLCDWCDQCHRKKGLVCWADSFRPDAGLPGGEALVALLLGKVDALEVDPRDRSQPLLPAWYRLLDAGLRVPLVGCSAKDSNRVPLGAVRTYAQIGQRNPFTYGSWVDAVRSGRTLVTNGPMVRLAVNGHNPGSAVELPEGDVPLRVEASAESGEAFDRLVLVANGHVFAEAAADPSSRSARIAVEHRLPEGGWLAARCVSGKKGALYPQTPVFAHTSPVYVSVSGKVPPGRDAARGWLRPLVEQTRQWVENDGRFGNPKSKPHLLELIDAAVARLGP